MTRISGKSSESSEENPTKTSWSRVFVESLAAAAEHLCSPVATPDELALRGRGVTWLKILVPTSKDAKNAETTTGSEVPEPLIVPLIYYSLTLINGFIGGQTKPER